jgi:hypothetical protein
MAAKSDFWMLVHSTAAALDNEGRSPAEQRGNLSESFHSFSPSAREELGTSFLRLMEVMRALAPEIERASGPPNGG